MIFTPYDYPDNLNMESFYEIYDQVKKAHQNGDNQLIFAKAPVLSDFPKDEGISFIIEEGYIRISGGNIFFTSL